MKKITFFRNLIVLVALLVGSGSAMGQTASVTLRPSHIDLSATTSESAVLMTLSGYSSNDARYRLYNGSYQYNPWNEDTDTYVSATSYGSGPLVLGTPTSSTTFWILFQRGNNNATAVSYRDRLGTEYSANYQTVALPSATSITSPYTLSGTFDGTAEFNKSTKHVALAFNGSTLVSASSTALTSGAFSIVCPSGVTIDKVEIRSVTNNVITTVTGSWSSTTNIGTIPSSSNPTVATPTFSPEAGTYYSDQNVTISTETAGATIRYTTNGNDPDETSTIFSIPIAVSATTTIKAKAFKTDMDPSDVASATYTIVKTPTITVTEPTVPAMSIAVGGTDTETITVNASNLTGNITLAVTGDDADLFTLSTYTLAHSSGSVSNQSVTITYTPDAPATSHTATLTLSSPGAENVVKELSGTATLAKPTATDATGISPSGFTANWDAVPGATSYELDVYKKQGSVATGLFISEYIEGSSNNKAIEIFNGTGSSVDLTGYNLKVYVNGSVTPGSAINLSGTLANQSVYVVANSSANATILAKANITSGSLTHNGNDAVGLFNGTTLLDVVGPIGDASNWGLDMTLIRKSSVTSPVTTYDVNEWNQESNDYVLNLGSHSTITITPVSGSPFTVTGETSKAITGLTASTQYFYTIKAINGSFESLVSEEETVTTSFGTSTDNPSSLTSIYAHNAKIHFAATAGEKVEVYNAVGQKIISTLATDGQNELPVNAKGVMIVKVGSRLAKVIL